ncbi:hypothetical protein ACIBKY_54440 [Nonomuraea sp. NPDC050394]|uniref:hypothetical protein n=1 Tax=Nonomuraea sp. NPDC050394 TaxID=3364363 RepID=UPI00379E2DDC
MARAEKGEVDYPAVCTPANLPVAIGGVDYRLREEAFDLDVAAAGMKCIWR